MHTAYFNLQSYGESSSFKISASDEESVAMFNHAFIALFPGLLDYETRTISPCFANVPEITNNVLAFVDQHKNQLPQLNHVASFFGKLKEGEMFFVFPFEKLEQKIAITIRNYLAAASEGKSFETLQSQMNDAFGDLLDDYLISAYGDERIAIGNSKKSERVCRFCNNTRVPLTFKNKAHAISEALGNKTVILYDECDGCNTAFSQTTEQEIVEFFSLIRTMYEIKGKDGVKKYKGKNFRMGYTEQKDAKGGDDPQPNKVLELQFEDNESSDDPKLPLTVRLQSNQKIAAQNIYKCFCKYFISVIPQEYLSNFKETIRWVNGEIEVALLPRIAKMSFLNELKQQPELVTYLRKSADRTLPFAVAEFHYAFTRHIFIVPLSNQDDCDFTRQEDYDRFWKKFQHFEKAGKAAFENFSDNRKKEFIIRINFESSQENS